MEQPSINKGQLAEAGMKIVLDVFSYTIIRFLLFSVYLWGPFWDGFIAQGLQSLHGSTVSGCLAGTSFSNKLMTAHRQLHIKELGNGIMVPGIHKTRGKTIYHNITQVIGLLQRMSKVRERL